MRIYTKAGDLAFKTFTFPDGQPHFKLETYEREFLSVTIEAAIKNPADLFQVVLVSSVLREHGYSEVLLDIRYLLGARMDRAISSQEPFTLQSVARIINSCGFNRVRILDAHSEVATRLIRNSSNVLPFATVRQVRNTCGYPFIVCPDKGARDRVSNLCAGYHVQCSKVRDTSTGALKGFSIESHGVNLPYESVLIVDDICDGGGTFVGLAKELRKAGAKKVFLFVTHGIFSKSVPLDGIDQIFTTDSYRDVCPCPYEHNVTVVPISMKDL
jgi:ribose-phosphate pyrophosphokinase